MTSIEWLEERFQMYLSWYEGHHNAKKYTIEDFAKDFEQAKEMHKQEIIDAYEEGKEYQYTYTILTTPLTEIQRIAETFKKDYTETQKNEERVTNAKIIRKVMSWEGCDGCTEQDEVMYKNGYAKGYNAAIAELTKEISDEEIEKGAKEWYNKEGLCKPSRVEVRAWVMACKWYREKLKNK